MAKKLFILLELVLFGVILFVNFYPTSISSWVLNHQVINSLVKYLGFVIVINLLATFIKFLYSKKNNLPIHKKNNVHFGIENIARVLIGLGFIIAAFGAFGIDAKSLLTSLSIVAAAIAIISREFINDFLVGLYFSFSKNFEINDYVKLGEHKGKISGIEILKIKLLNDDDDLVIIPNAKIYSNEIVNYTKRDIRLMSIDFQLDVKIIPNVEVLEEELISSISEFAQYIEEQSYNLKINEVKKDYLDLKFQYTLKLLDRDLQRQIRKKTVRKVFNYISAKTSEQALEK